MLDTILPSLQDVGRHLLPTLPSLSQEGKRQGRGLGTKLYLLGAKLRASPHPLSPEGLEGPVLPCEAAGNHSRLTWTSKDSFHFFSCAGS